MKEMGTLRPGSRLRFQQPQLTLNHPQLALSPFLSENSLLAHQSGCDVNIKVTSANDAAVSSIIDFKIIPIQASAQINVLSADDSTKPGETITGTVSVDNTGTGEDQFTLTMIGDDCDLSEVFTLSPGISSQSYPWSCVVDAEADAGSSSFTFRVTSSARSNYVLEVIEIYTVEPDWEGNNIAEISLPMNLHDGIFRVVQR